MLRIYVKKNPAICVRYCNIFAGFPIYSCLYSILLCNSISKAIGQYQITVWYCQLQLAPIPQIQSPVPLQPLQQ